MSVPVVENAQKPTVFEPTDIGERFVAASSPIAGDIDEILSLDEFPGEERKVCEK